MQAKDNADLQILQKSGKLFELNGQKCSIIRDKFHKVDKVVYVNSHNIELLRGLAEQEKKD